MSFSSSPPDRRAHAASAVAAFTLAEMLIATAVLSLLVVGLVAANIFGLTMFQLSENKLTVNDSARFAVQKLSDEIRTCSSALVGNVTNGIFAAQTDGEPQQGTGLLIYPTTNTTNFIIYFINPDDQSFRRSSSATGVTTLLAQNVTNTVAFTAQDCFGNVLTNSQNNRVFHADLEFYVPAGTGPTADHYKLETSVTRRLE
ncbi:conserved hypothetical protein [Verrucomicrobia bacterium]|nr:conserved hypothetical protein [Verrucomicrobiota bacterium]